MGSRENSAHPLTPQSGRGAQQQRATDAASRGAVDNGDACKPTASTTLDMFLSSLPPGSMAAPALASPTPARSPPPPASPGHAPRSPAPSSTSGGKKRTRGRQQQPSRSRRRRSGSEEWTPPRGDGADAASGPPTAVAASSALEESVDGAAAATGGQFQKGCGNPVVQVRLPPSSPLVVVCVTGRC